MSGIVLIGFMGAGKTTIGQLLAKKTNRNFYDIDQLIVDKIGMSIDEYFEKFGVESFRKLESEVLQEVIAEEHVISTGGGIVLSEENRKSLKKLPHVIYLKTELTELIHRIQSDDENIRPLAEEKSKDEIAEIYLPRVSLYEESGTIIVETTNKLPEEILEEILKQVGE